jgi:2-polyprenyl-3-methyl-5-hydroxy-6-metoxy-1,4-benzoquinol methylase
MEEQVYQQIYEVEKEHWWFTARKSILLRYLESQLNLSPNARVLDVGCGTGAILETLSRRYESYGTDTAPQAIAFCRQRGLTRLHLGTLATYPSSEPFDLITMLDVVEHVDDDLAFLRAARALLRPAGSVLIAVPAFPSLWSRHDEILHHRRRYTKRTLRALVNAAGFQIERLTFFNSLLFPIAYVKRMASRITGWNDWNDLDVPVRPLNKVLHFLFLLEGPLLPYTSFPLGLSLLCLARKDLT